VRVLARSEPIPTVPIVAHPDTPAEVHAQLRRALLAVDPKDPETRSRLEEWDAEFRNGFVEARVEDYASIFQLLDSVASTCGEGCHR
jgi:phosphonate transport system substrate-binding protein